MPDMSANARVSEMSISAVVIRCGCGDPLNIHPDSACPKPLAIEDRGQVSYWHSNPLKRLVWAARKRIT